ncbi:class I adenylate-forming enzyme family protein [Nocardioides sp. Iso805N]|uniref:class I adenylate-forming enzyme family protein n=1 Tax=Nocardioides sp. Iso805N TaxID=1283287 RepID=UPI000375E6A7|nr:AMP-binding protein [Nocardioides sp. Iso805N]
MTLQAQAATDRWSTFDVVSYATDPENMLPTRIRRWAEAEPERPFLIEAATERTASYGQLWEQARTWVRWLREEGVTAGDFVATVLPSSIDAAAVWLALGAIGAIEVPVNPELVGDFAAHVIKDASPTLCLGRPDLVGNLRACCPDLRIVEVERDGRFLDGVQPADIETLPGPEGVACIIYTSGTTGPAKGVVIRWAQFAAVVGRMPMEESDVSQASSPMFHVTGRTPLVVMADVGGLVVLRERFSRSEVLEDARRYRISVGTIIASLVLTLPPSPTDEDNAFRYVFTGHSPLLCEQWGERFGVRGYDCYGSTEIGFPIVRLEPPVDVERLWMGKIRRGWEGKVVDADGRTAADGESGELWIRAGSRLMLMGRYLNQPDATAAAFDGDWYKTGDIVIRHGDGNYEFLDRARDTIRRLGENISSTAVETAVEKHPDIALAAVVGVPDQVAGREVLLVVEPEPEARVEEEEFYAWLRTAVPKHALPRYLMVVGALRRTPTGKVLKQTLLDEVDLSAAWTPPSARRSSV